MKEEEEEEEESGRASAEGESQRSGTVGAAVEGEVWAVERGGWEFKWEYTEPSTGRPRGACKCTRVQRHEELTSVFVKIEYLQ